MPYNLRKKTAPGKGARVSKSKKTAPGKGARVSKSKKRAPIKDPLTGSYKSQFGQDQWIVANT